MPQANFPFGIVQNPILNSLYVNNTSFGSQLPSTLDYIITEDGLNILSEDGLYLITEINAFQFIVTDDDLYLFSENDNYIITEGV